MMRTAAASSKRERTMPGVTTPGSARRSALQEAEHDQRRDVGCQAADGRNCGEEPERPDEEDAPVHVVGKPAAGQEPDRRAGDIAGKHELRIVRRPAKDLRQHRDRRQDEVDRDADRNRAERDGRDGQRGVGVVRRTARPPLSRRNRRRHPCSLIPTCLPYSDGRAAGLWSPAEQNK